MRNVSLAKAMLSGLAVTIVAAVITLVVAFVTQATLEIPWVLRVSSASGGRPATDFAVNPLALILLAAVVGFLFWGIARLRRGAQD